jgi:hypothetical protein
MQKLIDQQGALRIMIGIFLLNHALDALGLYFALSVCWKVARGYGVLRAFW